MTLEKSLKMRSQAYERLNGKYLKEAQRLISKRDYTQASEKLWGTAAEMVKAVAARKGIELGTHPSLWDFVSQLDKEHPELMLKKDFSYAGNLHQNFYEDWLGRDYIEEGLAIMKSFVEKLRSFD
ncbi:MAG: hypothetical protein E6K96_00120 [Thaumarchaeota archaeon]|nr:MAG: hypothetical protein E6K96_00120 [Nitrososphaerota archaeon]